MRPLVSALYSAMYQDDLQPLPLPWPSHIFNPCISSTGVVSCMEVWQSGATSPSVSGVVARVVASSICWFKGPAVADHLCMEVSVCSSSLLSAAAYKTTILSLLPAIIENASQSHISQVSHSDGQPSQPHSEDHEFSLSFNHFTLTPAICISEHNGHANGGP